MARVELIMPKMGESVTEATIISWSKEIGDLIEIDDTIVEVATDKVDSEVPCTHSGKLIETLYKIDEVVQVGEPFAILETEEDENSSTEEKAIPTNSNNEEAPTNVATIKEVEETVHKAIEDTKASIKSSEERFYSPLVKNIASKEGISNEEMNTIKGTGKAGRVTKSDILNYVHTKKKNNTSADIQTTESNKPTTVNKTKESSEKPIEVTDTGNTEIIEMDRMRKLISSHMTMSKQTSAHITSFVEADMTNIVNWRNKVKEGFKQREGQNITFTPIIIEAMSKAVKDFPMINVSVEGTNIHIHKNINIGMAAALPDGNLIVPVIKECQNKNLMGITTSVNDLASRARAGKLNPDEIQGGTITMTNVGTFGNLMGTPIINQPQVAIMACGIIKKKPVVLETKAGDVIAIRHMMYLSLSYDHRVVDGSLGGQYVKRVAEYLEDFDSSKVI
jgi:2-oxoglutarate dehydrogenase E2 component (dihydrolipoamide succinyltransferase)